MSLQTKLAGPQSVTTSNATVGAAVPTGMTVKVNSITLQQPPTGDAKRVDLAIGTAATAANVVRSYVIPTGAFNFSEAPGIVLAAGEQLNVIQVGGTTAQVVLTASGVKDLATA